MNVIKGGKHSFPAGRGYAPSRGRGMRKNATGFDIIQYRPGPSADFVRAQMSSSTEMQTPSNLQLQMAISSSAFRKNSSSSGVTPAPGHNYPANTNELSSTSSQGFRPPYLRHTSTSSDPKTSSSSYTPVASIFPPQNVPKTPHSHKFKTPQNPTTPRTPRTASTSATSTDHINSHVILAITEGRGQARGEVGMAIIDIRRPSLILCQLSDSQTYSNTLTKINVFNPKEILVPNTFVEGTQSNKLYNLIQEKFHHVTMTKVQRRLFRDAIGLQQIQHLCLPEYASCQLVFQEKFYALAATAALLKYVEFIQNVIFTHHSLKVEYQGAEHGTIIDVKTAQGLELLLNQQTNSNEHTLLKLMDHCSTHAGSRLLRASLLHPPCSLQVISRRLDSVEELVQNPVLAQKIRDVLHQLKDVEQLLTLCMQTPSNLDNSHSMEMRHKYILLLKVTLDTVPQLVCALEGTSSYLISKACKTFQDTRFNQMKSRIVETINEDVKAPTAARNATFQRCFAVKSGVSELLDVARKTYCELINDIHDHVVNLGIQHSLPVKMYFSITRGYHIQIVLQRNRTFKESDLPAVFVQVHRHRNTFSCTTDSLIHANARINQAADEILTLSNVLLTTLLADIRQHISCLYQLCENIAEIDLIVALAQISSIHNYVRPKFGDCLQLKASRHPILDTITMCEPVANDVEACSYKNLKIITGPNMSGKSVYIKQVLLLQIMAQVGSYVPAEEATFRITDRIFSHLSFDDSIEYNASTLSLEMQETQLMLSCLTATSLVALDELCRGTSVEEGSALAWAICEDLSQRTAFVFFTTHFKELTHLASVYPCITNIHLEAVERELQSGQQQLIYTHRLLPGRTEIEHYGLRLAEAYNFPDSIVKEAYRIASTLKTRSELSLVCLDENEDYVESTISSKLKSLTDNGKLIVETAPDLQIEHQHQNLKRAIEHKTTQEEYKTPVPHYDITEKCESTTIIDLDHEKNTVQLVNYESSERSVTPHSVDEVCNDTQKLESDHESPHSTCTITNTLPSLGSEEWSPKFYTVNKTDIIPNVRKSLVDYSDDTSISHNTIDSFDEAKANVNRDASDVEIHQNVTHEQKSCRSDASLPCIETVNNQSQNGVPSKAFFSSLHTPTNSHNKTFSSSSDSSCSSPFGTRGTSPDISCSDSSQSSCRSCSNMSDRPNVQRNSPSLCGDIELVSSMDESLYSQNTMTFPLSQMRQSNTSFDCNMNDYEAKSKLETYANSMASPSSYKSYIHPNISKMSMSFNSEVEFDRCFRTFPESSLKGSPTSSCNEQDDWMSTLSPLNIIVSRNEYQKKRKSTHSSDVHANVFSDLKENIIMTPVQKTSDVKTAGNLMHKNTLSILPKDMVHRCDDIFEGPTVEAFESGEPGFILSPVHSQEFKQRKGQSSSQCFQSKVSIQTLNTTEKHEPTSPIISQFFKKRNMRRIFKSQAIGLQDKVKREELNAFGISSNETNRVNIPGHSQRFFEFSPRSSSQLEEAKPNTVSGQPSPIFSNQFKKTKPRIPHFMLKRKCKVKSDSHSIPLHEDSIRETLNKTPILCNSPHEHQSFTFSPELISPLPVHEISPNIFSGKDVDFSPHIYVEEHSTNNAEVLIIDPNSTSLKALIDYDSD